MGNEVVLKPEASSGFLFLFKPEADMKRLGVNHVNLKSSGLQNQKLLAWTPAGCWNQGKIIDETWRCYCIYTLEPIYLCPYVKIYQFSKKLSKQKRWSQHGTNDGIRKTSLLQTSSRYQKGKKQKQVFLFVWDHGSLPLRRLCCSIRPLRSMSMCLALSQVSLHREVCPRLRDSNLPTESQSVPLKHASAWSNSAITFLWLGIADIFIVVMTCSVYLMSQLS